LHLFIGRKLMAFAAWRLRPVYHQRQ